MKNKELISELEELSKNTPDSEILNLNIEEDDPELWIDYPLRYFQELWPHDLKGFNNSIKKHGVVDLACGETPTLASFIFFRSKQRKLKPATTKHEIPKKRIFSKPKEYIGVDKYNVNESHTSGKIKFFKQDNIVFLRTLPDNSANILLGAFNDTISKPTHDFEFGNPRKEHDDKYRALLLHEMARVIPKKGYLVSFASYLDEVCWKKGKISITDFGLVEIENIYIKYYPSLWHNYIEENYCHLYKKAINVYIAAKWQLKDEVNELYEQFEEAGHVITEKWTEHTTVKPYDRKQKLSARNSEKNIEGVRDSDVFVLLSEPKEGIGKSAEFGAAVASYLETGSPIVYVLGKETNQSEHYFHPAVKRVKSIETILRDIEKM